MSSGKILLGLLAGIAAGATLGILLAPDKGSSTRKKLVKKGDDYVEEFENKFNDFIDGVNRKYESVKDKYESVKDKALHMAENGKDKYESVKDKALHMAENGKDKIEQLDGEFTAARK